MQKQCAGSCGKQQILCSSGDRLNAEPGQDLIEFFGHWPAQLRLAYDDLFNDLSFNMRRYASAGGFNFG